MTIFLAHIRLKVYESDMVLSILNLNAFDYGVYRIYKKCSPTRKLKIIK